MNNSFVLSVGLVFGAVSLNVAAKEPSPYLQVNNKKYELSVKDTLNAATKLVAEKPDEIVPQLSWNAGNVQIPVGNIYDADGKHIGGCRINGKRSDNQLPFLTNFVTNGSVKYALQYQSHCWLKKPPQWQKIDFTFQP